MLGFLLQSLFKIHVLTVLSFPANPVAKKQGYEQFSDISKYGEPKLPELMDMVVTKVHCMFIFLVFVSVSSATI